MYFFRNMKQTINRNNMEDKVAVITGANAGIGLSLAERLLTDHVTIHICLACRNKGRAEVARQKLLRRHPDADISIVIVDTSSVKSVLHACEEIRNKYSRIDYIYLNAGIMRVSSVNWWQVASILTSLEKSVKLLSTGEGALNHIDEVTEEGLQQVFATNLFGHFTMIRELEDHIVTSGGTTLVWTSSQNADSGALNLTDIQHRHGKEPYSSSKYATDVISCALNNKLNKKGINSVTMCPGLVLSNMTFNIMPSLFWMFLLPFLYFMRLFVKSLTCSCYNGAEALVWVAKQKTERLDPQMKYVSLCSVLGKPYVGEEKLTIETTDADKLYNQLDMMYQGFKEKYSPQSKTQNGEQKYTTECNSQNGHQ